MTAPLTTWLLDSDPALRWQVERDLLIEPPDVWESTRSRIATEGFGAQLLAKQDVDGQWAGARSSPPTSTWTDPKPRAAGNPGPRPHGR